MGAVFRGRWENVDGSVADGLEKSWREERIIRIYYCVYEAGG